MSKPKLSMMDQLKKSLNSPSPSVLKAPSIPAVAPAIPDTITKKPEEQTTLNNETKGKTASKAITITLYPEDLKIITDYRMKTAGQGNMLNVSEVVRAALRKLK